jgi:hypothetical protein
VVALEIEKYLAKEAEERRRAAISAARRREMVQLFAPSRSDKSRDQAATLVGTNSHYVSDAKRIVRKSPEVLELVRRGELTNKKLGRWHNEKHVGLLVEGFCAIRPSGRFAQFWRRSFQFCPREL